MKLKHIACIAALAATPMAYAQHGAMKGMDHSQGAAHGTAAQAHRASGTVKALDAAKGTVSVAHGPVASLQWPAMTMTFKAQSADAVKNLKPGARVEFEFEQRGKDYVITRIH